MTATSCPGIKNLFLFYQHILPRYYLMLKKKVNGVLCVFNKIDDNEKLLSETIKKISCKIGIQTV